MMVALLVKNPPANAGETRAEGSNPGSGRSPGGGYSNPLNYSSLDNPMDRGTWWATAHGVTKSQTRLKQLSTHTGARKTYGSQSRKHLPSGSSHTKIFLDHYRRRN